MKKTSIIILGLTLLLAQGCSDDSATDDDDRDEWVAGDSTSRDTVVQGKHYRSYHGSYYPVYRGYISPHSYMGSSYTQIITRSYQPSRRYSGSSYSSRSSKSYSGGSSGTSYRSTSGSRSSGFGSSSRSYSSSSRSSGS